MIVCLDQLRRSLLPTGGYIAAGLYHGLNETLMTNSDGKVVKTGAMIAAGSPDIQIGLKGLKKINIVGDIQTGNNVLGAWGFGTNVYFADNVSLLVGPVFFLDKNLQPGGHQIHVDRAARYRYPAGSLNDGPTH